MQQKFVCRGTGPSGVVHMAEDVPLSGEQVSRSGGEGRESVLDMTQCPTSRDAMHVDTRGELNVTAAISRVTCTGVVVAQPAIL